MSKIPIVPKKGCKLTKSREKTIERATERSIDRMSHTCGRIIHRPQPEKSGGKIV